FAIDAGRDANSTQPQSGLRLYPEQPGEVTSENCLLLGITERGRSNDEVQRIRPSKRHIRAVNDLTCAHLRDQVTKRFLGEHHRVGEDLRSQILAGAFAI